MKMNSNTLFIILSACIVAAGAYWYFFMTMGNQPPLTVSGVDNQKQIQFQALVSKLPTTFDTKIFSDSKFLSLQDITIDITPEPIGHTDPFSPIAGVSAQK